MLLAVITVIVVTPLGLWMTFWPRSCWLYYTAPTRRESNTDDLQPTARTLSSMRVVGCLTTVGIVIFAVWAWNMHSRI
jgi:hypothetical protein